MCVHVCLHVPVCVCVHAHVQYSVSLWGCQRWAPLTGDSHLDSAQSLGSRLAKGSTARSSERILALESGQEQGMLGHQRRAATAALPDVGSPGSAPYPDGLIRAGTPEVGGIIPPIL